MADVIPFIYTDGFLSIETGSDIVNGIATAWDLALLPNDILWPNFAGVVPIVQVISATQMRLAAPWPGPTVTEVPYFALRWIAHTDPRVYGVRVAEYLRKLRAIPDGMDDDMLAEMVRLHADTVIKAAAAAGSASTANTAKGLAEIAAMAAQGARDQAQASLTAMRNIDYGPLASDPATRPDGSPRVEGDFYYKTTPPKGLRVFDGANWSAAVLDTAGALMAVNNLSDLADKAAARTNLGLGNAATLNVGTVAGTVAAGDDPRIVGAVLRDQTPGPNLIINSGFIINQRGYIWGTALAAGAFGPDRWKAGSGGGTMTFAATSGPVNVATIAAGTFVQVVAGEDVEGGTYTLSWAGTAPGRINGGAYAASPIVVTGVTAGSNLTVEFGTGSLSKVRLEPGSAVTKYTARQTQVEIALCQRFFFRSATPSWFNGNSGNSTVARGCATFPVPMRSMPSVTITGGVAYITNNNSNTAAGVIAVDISLTGFGSIGLASGFPSQSYLYAVTCTASAEL